MRLKVKSTFWSSRSEVEHKKGSVFRDSVHLSFVTLVEIPTQPEWEMGSGWFRLMGLPNSWTQKLSVGSTKTTCRFKPLVTRPLFLSFDYDCVNHVDTTVTSSVSLKSPLRFSPYRKNRVMGWVNGDGGSSILKRKEICRVNPLHHVNPTHWGLSETSGTHGTNGSLPTVTTFVVLTLHLFTFHDGKLLC